MWVKLYHASGLQETRILQLVAEKHNSYAGANCFANIRSTLSQTGSILNGLV